MLRIFSNTLKPNFWWQTLLSDINIGGFRNTKNSVRSFTDNGILSVKSEATYIRCHLLVGQISWPLGMTKISQSEREKQNKVIKWIIKPEINMDVGGFVQNLSLGWTHKRGKRWKNYSFRVFMTQRFIESEFIFWRTLSYPWFIVISNRDKTHTSVMLSFKVSFEVIVNLVCGQ